MRGVAGIAAAVEDDLGRRLPLMNVARRRGISQVVAAMLTVRSANMVELGNVLPREIASLREALPVRRAGSGQSEDRLRRGDGELCRASGWSACRRG